MLIRPKESVASVTLAYNSAKVLSRQIDSLLRQSRPLDEIIVVNNGSTDGTSELLAAKYSQVTVLDLPSNLGAGGGYAAGLEYAATKRKHDWVWLLDDDSVPMENGLEILLEASAMTQGSSQNVGVMASVPSHSATQLSYPGMIWQNGWKRPAAEFSNRPVCFVDAVISSGSLVRREVVERVGLPRADFFIDFVDFEYCLRIRRFGYRIGIVRDSILEHEVGRVRTIRMLGYSKVWADHAPWREYYLSRNYTSTIWEYFPDVRSKLFVLGWLLRHASAISLFGKKKGACLRMMLMGFLDGRAGRLGIRFLDDVETKQLSSAGPLQKTEIPSALEPQQNHDG
jgi:GT2 family glycosyltransferase